MCLLNSGLDFFRSCIDAEHWRVRSTPLWLPPHHPPQREGGPKKKARLGGPQSGAGALAPTTRHSGEWHGATQAWSSNAAPSPPPHPPPHAPLVSVGAAARRLVSGGTVVSGHPLPRSCTPTFFFTLPHRSLLSLLSVFLFLVRRHSALVPPPTPPPPISHRSPHAPLCRPDSSSHTGSHGQRGPRGSHPR